MQRRLCLLLLVSARALAVAPDSVGGEVFRDYVVIAGFVIPGTPEREVLIRAVGP
jgi:hypothetical protein